MCEELRRKVVGVGCALALLLALPASADTVYLGFTAFNNSAQYAQDVALQMQVAVDEVTVHLDGNDWQMARFIVSNNGPTASNIAMVYWDWEEPDVLDPTPPLPGAFYVDPAHEWTLDNDMNHKPPHQINPHNLPGGNGIDFYALAGGGSNDSGGGLGVGESATFFMGINPEVSGDTLLAALNDGRIRMGLHVRGIADVPTGLSDSVSLVSHVVPVPLPGAAGLGLLGFGMVAFLRRKRAGGLA